MAKTEKEKKPLTLTEAKIKALMPTRNDAGELVNTSYWDKKITGLGIQITPQGRRTFVFKFRLDGKQGWIQIGQFTNAASVVSAREKAAKYRELVDNGKDPRAMIQKERAVPTLAEYVKTFLFEQKSRVRPSTLTATTTYLDDLVVPAIGRIRLSEIERGHVSKLYKDLARGWRPWLKSGDEEVPTPILANRALAALSKLFSAAAKDGHLPQAANPCHGLMDRKAEKPRKRRLSKAETEWLHRVLTLEGWDTKKDGPRPPFHAIEAIKLLLVTGCRLNEVLSLTWDQVDLEAKTLRFERHKTSDSLGPKVIPFNSDAEKVLLDLKAWADADAEKKALLEVGKKVIPLKINDTEEETPVAWVFVGARGGQHLVGLEKIWQRVKDAVYRLSKKKTDLRDVRLHDLRHGFASSLAAGGASLPVIKHLLGHLDPRTTDKYLHLDAEDVREASEEGARRIMGREKKTGEAG